MKRSYCCGKSTGSGRRLSLTDIVINLNYIFLFKFNFLVIFYIFLINFFFLKKRNYKSSHYGVEMAGIDPFTDEDKLAGKKSN